MSNIRSYTIAAVLVTMGAAAGAAVSPPSRGDEVFPPWFVGAVVGGNALPALVTGFWGLWVYRPSRSYKPSHDLS